MKQVMAAAMTFVAVSAFADVTKTAVKPTVDGKLDEAIWSQADWESGFRRYRNAQRGRAPTAQTEFAILGDDDALYVGVKAHHKKMADVKAMGQYAIWEAEGVELYFCPDGGTFDFYQFLVTYQGLNHAIFYSEGGNIQPDPYAPEWEAKTLETPEGWTAEVRIPLSAFYMTRGNAWKDTWKLNVARSYREAGDVYDFSCWIDGDGFRDLRNFKTMKGFPIRRSSEDVWVKSAVANVKGPKDGRICGLLDFVVNVAQAGRFTLTSGFTDALEVQLKGGDNQLSVPAHFPANGRHQMPIALTRTDGSAVCKRAYPVLVDYQPIRLAFSTPRYRGNFYPGQNSDLVAGTVVSAVEGAVTVTLDGPGFGKRAMTLGKDGAFSFDTKGFEVGTAVLTVKAGGETLTRKVRKLALLGEGRHVSWVEDGHLVVDGKPVLRRNMYAEYYMGGMAFKKKYDADDLHLTKHVKEICTLEPDRLIRGIGTREAIRDVRPSDELFRAIDAAIERNGKGTGAFYYISDEPECRQLSPVYLRYVYDYVCDKDPYHVILSCSRAGETYMDCADWFETHPYINAHYVDGKRVYGRQFNELGDYISAFKPENHPDKCVGGTATCFCYSGGDYPTFTEYIANAWCEFLRGAKTLFPYAYHDLGDRASIYEGTRYLFSSAEALEDLLLLGRRQTLARTSDYEAAIWTMPDGETMFCVQNFSTAPVKASVPGISGRFLEFRGERVFDLVAPAAIELMPLESLVATSRKRGDGLPTFAATQAKIDALEAERLGRENQLLGRFLEIEAVTSVPGNDSSKMFDGTRDVVAWVDNFNKEKFYEMAFPKFVPNFSELTVYGCNIEGMKVRIREGGEWKELVPVKTEKGEFSVRYVLDRTYATVKLRLEFPKDRVELYEIELPGKPRELGVSKANELVKKNSTDLWVRTVPKGQSTHFAVSVPRESGSAYLSFDFRQPALLQDGKYTSWGIYLEKTAGWLAGDVNTVYPGLYTLRVPRYEGDCTSDQLVVRTYNLALDMGDVVCSREPPENRVEFVEDRGKWAVRVTVSERCEDVVCSILYDWGRGAEPFSADGKSSFEMRPVDADGKVWIGVMPIPQNGMRRDQDGKLLVPFVRATVLGGSVEKPMLSWLYRKSANGEVEK